MHLTDHHHCSSVDEVISKEELLIEIQLRLPIISILLFKSVSTRWLSIITSPYFTFRLNQMSNIDLPCGLFLEKPNYSTEYHLVRLDSPNRSPFQITFPFGHDKKHCVEILQSCNGLLLCYIKPYSLFVYNPSTSQFKFFPGKLSSKIPNVIRGVRLVFDPTKSSHYKLVHARERDVDVDIDDSDDDVDFVDPFVEILTYSSETCRWITHDERYPPNCFLDFDRGVYWNGGINWIGSGGLHYQLDVNHLVLTTIEKPGSVVGNMYYDYKLFESRGCLFLVCISCIDNENGVDSRKLNVYKMRNESSEWLVQCVIDFGYIMSLIPNTWELPGRQINVRCIVVGERDEDSFILLEVFGKAALYKMVLKTICKILDFSLAVFEPSCFRCFPFIPSIASV